MDPAVLDGSAGPFEQRLEALCADLVAAPTAPGAPGRVLIPGEPEAAAERLSERRGVVLDGRHHAALVGLGETAGLPFPEVGPVEPAASPSFGRLMTEDRVDLAIVGGGILGLATAYRLLERHPGHAARDPREGGRARHAPVGPQFAASSTPGCTTRPDR